MFKKILTVTIFCIVTSQTFAQRIAIDFNKNEDNISPIVREKIENFQLKIKKIVNEEKEILEKELNKIDSLQKIEDFSKDSVRLQKEELAKISSEKINARIQKINFDLDEIIKNQVAFAILNGKDSTIQTRKNLERKYRATHDITTYIGYGFMGFSNKSNQNLDNHLNGFANNLEIGLSYDKQINRKSPWTIKSGLYLSWRTIRLNDNYKFIKDNNGVVGIEKNETNLDKSKLRGSYLILPIGIEYSFGKIKNIDDFKYYKKSKISLVANVYGGVKLRNNNIIKGDNIKQRDTNDYRLNSFIYGAEFKVKYGNFGVFFKQEFSPYFKTKTFDNRKMFQFGLSLGI